MRKHNCVECEALPCLECEESKPLVESTPVSERLALHEVPEALVESTPVSERLALHAVHLDGANPRLGNDIALTQQAAFFRELFAPLTQSSIVSERPALHMLHTAGEAPRLGDSVMLASLELKGTDDDDLVPALMDNGASKGTSCIKSLEGALPGTLRLCDAGDIGLGSDGAVLTSTGSYLYVLHRHAANGSEIVVRRLKHTPSLPMAMVFSEASENGEHGYGIYWPPGEKRRLQPPGRPPLELFMSSSNLGWMKVKAVTDPKVIREAIIAHKQLGKPGLATLTNSPVQASALNPQAAAFQPSAIVAGPDPGRVRSVGMGTPKPLKGVALLRRRHCTDGHPALAVSVKNLRLEGAFNDGRLTLKDVELFAQQGCGTCELTKMRRRAFTIKVAPLDPTPPVLGKLWTFDVLELRVPAEHTGDTYLYAAVEKVSKFPLAGGMSAYTDDGVEKVINEVRARVRPTHGEINVLRMDSHPTHRSKRVRDYLLDAQLRLQLSPGHVHEGVGDPENLFLHQVPSANALLAATPHMGENHFTQAFRYVLHAKSHSVTLSSSPPTSPAMIYYRMTNFVGSNLLVFGSEGKALIHGEARGSKFDDHAQPCVYAGPPINSDSNAHCAVWHKREYYDVDLGCANFDERSVIERTLRDHPSTQPFTQVAATKTVDLGKPSSIYDLSGMDYTPDELPVVQPIVWVRGGPEPSSYFAVLLWHGQPRPGDMAAWVHEFSVGKVVPVPIEICIGGQEHNTNRSVVKKAIHDLNLRDTCVGTFMQPKCKDFTAARFHQPGPPVLFNLDHPDGIPDEHGELPPEVLITLNEVAFVALIFRTASSVDGKVVVLEFPSSQCSSSPFAAKGRELHSTIADTTIMRKLIEDMELEMVFTEQGGAGAESRKPTTLLCTRNASLALRRSVGTLYAPNAAKTLIGTDDNGNFMTSASEVYTPKFAMLVTIGFLGGMSRIVTEQGELVDPGTRPPAVDDLFPVGTVIELWWFGDKAWYKGTVVDSRVRKGPVHGRSVSRREIQVRYHDDDKLLWHALCDYSIREAANDENQSENVVMSLLQARRDACSGSDASDAAMLNLMQPFDSDVLSRLSTEFLARRGAEFRMASLRTCTSFAVETDEAMACGADQRELQILLELDNRTSSGNGAKLVARAFDELKSAYSAEEWEQMQMERAEWLERSAPDAKKSSSLRNHQGEVFVLQRILLDIEDGSAVDPVQVLAVLDDGKVQEVDYSRAHTWHVPRNEREYNMSPQRDLWRTAKELKIDNYNAINMVELVPESSVDKSKYAIYDTLWAYKIKFKEGGLIFDKLNPRWCLKGGGMDRDLYKSYAEMMRATSMNVMWGLKALFYKMLAAGLLDLSDAFQATSTVDADGKLKDGEQEVYCRQPPGFVKYGPGGERLVCRLRCYMQGRIDATRGFDKRATQILTKDATFKQTLWDPKVYLFNTTKYASTTAPLTDIIAEGAAIVSEGRDSDPQSPPLGWGLIGQHVDDMMALATGATDPESNRIITFVRGCIAVTYACKLTGWHGEKVLGFDMQLNDEACTVRITAQGTYQALRSRLITDDNFKCQPRHIVTEAVYEASPGQVPEVGDPARASYLERQALTRSALGGGIWLSQAYPQIQSGINAMCVDMANPSDSRLGQLKHMVMYLGERPAGKTFGGPHVKGVLHSDTVVAPFTAGAKAGYFHFFSDAAINVTGGIGMFAGACIQGVSLRQHRASPCAHSSEIVAAGTNVSFLMSINGLLQELSIRLGLATILYLDSASSVFVASSDTAPKNSVWLTRRNKVLTEAVEFGECRPVYIDEHDMVADSNTKYIRHDKWSRHMHYVLNLSGDPPECYKEGEVRVKPKKIK